MQIQTYNRNKPIAVKLGSGSSNHIVTVFQARADAEDSQYLLEGAEHVIYNGFVKTLRAKVIINSIAETTLPGLTIEQSRNERLMALRNVEWNSPRKQLDLYFAEHHGNWVNIGSVSLLNIPPFRIINLMEYFTENIAVELGSTGAIGVAVKDVGYGLLGANDEIVVYGSGTTEVVVIPYEPRPIEACTDYGWTVSAESALILPAQDNRKQITFVNTGAGTIYLNLGAAAEVGKGIALMPRGGSYEFNRANNPYNGSIHAVATEASELTALVCL